MNIDGIITFMMIVETRSISKAAEHLHITQSTVSHRLRALENEIGFQLINRKQGQRFIELTQKGEEFIGIADKQMSLNREISHLQNAEPYQSLKIGCVETLNSVVFPPFYKKLITTIPNLTLSISSHWSFVIYNLLQDHDIDVGFVLKQIQSKNILCEPVFEERMVLVYNPDFTDYPHTIHPSELNTSREIFLSWSPDYHSWHDYWFPQSNHPYVNVDTSTLIRSFLIDSGHWTIVPYSLARYFQKIYNFKTVELQDPPPKRICYKITHRYLNPGRKSTLDRLELCLNEFRKDPDFTQCIK